MKIFDFFKNISGDTQPDIDAEALLEKMAVELSKRDTSYFSSESYGNQLVKKYFREDEVLKKRFLLYYSTKISQFHLNKQKKQLSQQEHIQENIIFFIFHSIIDELDNFSDEELLFLITNWHDATRGLNFWNHYSVEKIFKAVLAKVSVSGLTDPLRKCLKMAKTPDDLLFYHERRKLNDKIDFVLQGQQDLPIHRHDRLGPVILDFVEKINDDQQKAKWINLLNHCLKVEGKSFPSQKWLNEAESTIKSLTENNLAEKIIEWLTLVKSVIIEIHKSKNDRTDFLRDINHDLLKGLVWCACFTKNDSLINILDDYASWAYRKKPGVGSISIKTGTACMFVFSQLPFKDGISKLTKFRMKIKNNSILKSIDKIIHDISVKNGISKDELEELGVPDFGLNDKGIFKTQIGEFVARFSVDGLRTSELMWEKDGKAQKAIPALIKSNFASELKILKSLIKEIESLMPAHKERIEQFFLKQRSWEYEKWKKNYIDHPLIGTLSRKLIWHFSNEERKVQGMWLNNELVDANQKPLSFTNETEVQLWHPIGFRTEEIVAWRNFLQTNKITQPFKQAYREIYIITDAELNTDTYSNRFAAHILRQHQFAALCKQRGWQYHLMGQWDSHNTPVIKLDKWNIRAQYFVDADWQGTANPAGIFSYISTDQVRFYKEANQLRISDVPAIVFTEIMRDVDLFVGVTSIGNDPAWQNNGNNNMNTYWHEYSFADLSESAKIRSEILRNLIPKLKIAGSCSFDGKYLLVKGKIRNYKIHMGSGNILMEPDDRYLCIVPERSGEKSTEKLYLPFEGDNLLSIILSKAFLLSEDNKITDTTIVRQINNNTTEQ
ncbi:MAG TPA: DUF4132 domain-containing protein [Puia sp.]|nr:DUF4132 domain-containing protein [Puia sp.]